MTPGAIVPELEAVSASRIAAKAAALDTARWPAGSLALRIAPDEVLLIGGGRPQVDDPHAMVVADGGWCGVWLPAEQAYPFLRGAAAWPMPDDRPAFAQGMVAGLPVKLWLEDDRVLFIVPAAFATDFEERSP
jgi:hypothetical protein